MNADLAALLYLVSGVLFILALRGLSSPETSRQGNTFGMVGMGIAIATTLWLVGPDTTTWIIIVAAIVIGGSVDNRRIDDRSTIYCLFCSGIYISTTIPFLSSRFFVHGTRRSLPSSGICGYGIAVATRFSDTSWLWARHDRALPDSR